MEDVDIEKLQELIKITEYRWPQLPVLVEAAIEELKWRRKAYRTYEAWPCPGCGRHRVQVPGTYRPSHSTPENKAELSRFQECEKCGWRPTP